MEIISLDYVVEALQRRKGIWREIATETEVPYDTLSKIARGVTVDPGVRGVERLAANLKARDEQEKVDA